jgi:transposase-like protein
MKCPICEKEFTRKPLKKWTFGPYSVSRYECPICNEQFNFYEAEGRKNFTIPKGGYDSQQT